jgi:hypothetical protein
MPRATKEEKVKAANILLPIYNRWHRACLDDFESVTTRCSAASLMQEASKYSHLGVPTKIHASVGRWVARTLGKTWRSFEGIV